MAYTDSALTTEIHRKWSAIALVAGALERRVWVKVGDRVTFPNLYILLVAPPGVGKFIVEEVRAFWEETIEPTGGLAFHTAPDSVTKASLMDALVKAKSIRLPIVGPPLIYHPLLIASEEFEVLLPSYDTEFISRLNRIWNNPSHHSETRRTGSVRELSIEFPQLNILAGAQPAYFVSHFPEEAWNTGLIRRIIMVYSGETPLKDVFAETPDRSRIRQQILLRLGHLSQLLGPMSWRAEAAEAIRAWHLASAPPTPTHSKLTNYVRSRTLFRIKLSMISAISRTGELTIHEIDTTRALSWLLEAESLMPDIFREMIGRSDSQIIEELHYFVHTTWAKGRQSPVGTASIIRFLGMRCPSEKVPHVFDLAEKMDVIARVAGTLDQWIPRPKQLHGVE